MKFIVKIFDLFSDLYNLCFNPNWVKDVNKAYSKSQKIEMGKYKKNK